MGAQSYWHLAPQNRLRRLFLQAWVSALTLILLFSLAAGLVQAVESHNTPCRILDGAVVQIDPAKVDRCAQGVSAAGDESSQKPVQPPVERAAPPDLFPVPGWVIWLTVVVIALCVAIGAIGTRLTEPRLITR